jgi:hypothetical protein
MLELPQRRGDQPESDRLRATLAQVGDNVQNLDVTALLL